MAAGFAVHGVSGTTTSFWMTRPPPAAYYDAHWSYNIALCAARFEGRCFRGLPVQPGPVPLGWVATRWFGFLDRAGARPGHDLPRLPSDCWLSSWFSAANAVREWARGATGTPRRASGKWLPPTAPRVQYVFGQRVTLPAPPVRLRSITEREVPDWISRSVRRSFTNTTGLGVVEYSDRPRRRERFKPL